MGSTVITYECSDKIARIGLNRPDKRNALSEDLQRQLIEAAKRAESEAKVAIVHSTSEHFCAGLDLAQLLSWVGDPQILRQKMRARRSDYPFYQISHGSIPFIAAISGACVGGGLEIASSCHLRVADTTAFFALPEAQRGIYLGGGGSARITRLLGVPLMTDMMLTGRVINGEEGERRGLVNYLVPQGGALARAEELAARIRENAEIVNSTVISWLPRFRELSVEDGLFAEAFVAESVMSGAAPSRERLEEFVSKKARPLDRPAGSGKE